MAYGGRVCSVAATDSPRLRELPSMTVAREWRGESAIMAMPNLATATTGRFLRPPALWPSVSLSLSVLRH